MTSKLLAIALVAIVAASNAAAQSSTERLTSETPQTTRPSIEDAEPSALVQAQTMVRRAFHKLTEVERTEGGDIEKHASAAKALLREAYDEIKAAQPQAIR